VQIHLYIKLDEKDSYVLALARNRWAW